MNRERPRFRAKKSFDKNVCFYSNWNKKIRIIQDGNAMIGFVLCNKSVKYTKFNTELLFFDKINCAMFASKSCKKNSSKESIIRLMRCFNNRSERRTNRGYP